MMFTKKTITLLICLFLQGFIFNNIKAQSVNIPTTNAGSIGATINVHRKPLGAYYGYERSAIIYKASEINASGSITSISFFCDTLKTENNVPVGNVPVKIYMKEIVQNAFINSTTIQAEENNSALVYSGILNGSIFSQGNFVNITLDVPFVYGGVKNLEVIIETNVGNNGNENNLIKGFRNHKIPAEFPFQYWQSDNTEPSSVGALEHFRPNVLFNLVPVVACSGLPTAGNAAISAPSLCVGAVFQLSLSGYDKVGGLFFQWQTSRDALTWKDLNGFNAPNCNSVADSARYFRCKVTCGANESISNTVQISINPPTACYCSSLAGNCSAGYYIDSVAIANTSLDNRRTGCGKLSGLNYSSFPASGSTTCTLQAGQKYSMAVKLFSSNITSMWIDYNQDGIFGVKEWVQLSTSSTTNVPILVDFTVPSTAINGLTGLRIRTRAENQVNDSTSACSNFGTGETEDYHITIAGGVIGIKELSYPSIDMNVYPNPNNGVFSIETKGIQKEALLRVYSITGEIVYTEVFYSASQKTINLKDAPAGIYFVLVSEGENSISRKIVIQ